HNCIHVSQIQKSAHYSRDRCTRKIVTTRYTHTHTHTHLYCVKIQIKVSKYIVLSLCPRCVCVCVCVCVVGGGVVCVCVCVYVCPASPPCWVLTCSTSEGGPSPTEVKPSTRR